LLDTLFFALLASHFLVLVPQKVTKEEDTQPSRPKGFLALLKLGLSSVALPDLSISQSRNST